MDWCVTVWDSSGLQDALCNNFVATEMLEGSNKYRCDGCKQLANAKKVTGMIYIYILALKKRKELGKEEKGSLGRKWRVEV